MALTATPPPPDVLDVDAGVIEEARERQRRQRWWVAMAAAVLVIVTVLLLVLGGGRSTADRGGLTAAQPSKLTFKHGYAYVNGQPIQVGIAPYLRAGWVELEMTQSIVGPGLGLASGLSGYPTQAAPAFGFPAEGISFRRVHGMPVPVSGAPVGPAGEIDMLLVGPTVASMRVAHLGTFKPVRVLGLLPGERAIVFYRPPGAIGAVIGPGLSARLLPPFATYKHASILTETLYNSAGKIIPIKWPKFHVPIKFWAAPATSAANGRCALRSALAGAMAQWGTVATAILADPSVIGPAFLSCLYTSYRWHSSSFEVGVLVKAQSPGSAPAPLWNATSLPGHPGIVQVKPVKYTERIAVEHAGQPVPGRYVTVRHELAPGSVARRVGNAWLIVRGGKSLAQRIGFLNGLHLTRLNLRHG